MKFYIKSENVEDLNIINFLIGEGLKHTSIETLKELNLQKDWDGKFDVECSALYDDKNYSELAASLVLNFFNSCYYIIFENTNDVEEFLKYIRQYDSRYDENFKYKDKIKSVFWKYSNILHKHQLAWDTSKERFKRYDARELPYKKIKPYIKIFNDFSNKI